MGSTLNFQTVQTCPQQTPSKDPKYASSLVPFKQLFFKYWLIKYAVGSRKAAC